MAQDFKALSVSMRKIAADVQKNTDKRKRLTGLVIGSELVNETPVDEGRARSNWQASNSSPINNQIPAYVPGKNGATKSENTQKALDQIKQSIDKNQENQSIFIVNNLPYIEPLNQGHSAQVSPGWIERSIERGNEAGEKIQIVEGG